MNNLKFFLPSVFILVMTINGVAQKKSVKLLSPPLSKTDNNQILKSSPAFAEIILRKTELQSELESLLISYTEEFPKVGELRFELDALDKEIGRLSAVKIEESAKLTLALGKLLVRKAELETDFRSLQKKYGDDHPEVKRARRKVEIYENSIKEILN